MTCNILFFNIKYIELCFRAICIFCAMVRMIYFITISSHSFLYTMSGVDNISFADTKNFNA